MKRVVIGVAVLLSCAALLVSCGSRAKKEEKTVSSSTSKSVKKSSSEVKSSVPESSETVETSETPEPEVNTSSTPTELTTLEATVEGKIALALAKMQSVTPDRVNLNRLTTEPQFAFKAQASSYGYTEYFISNSALDDPSIETVGGYAYCFIIRDDSFVQYGTQALPPEDPATTNPIYYFKELTAQEIQLAMSLKDKIVVN